MTTHQAQVPSVAAAYFAAVGVDTGQPGNHPVIKAEFTPGHGWKAASYRKRISGAWARKLASEGVTSVQLSAGGHCPDFRIAELTRRGNDTKDDNT
jgi:hypothetical protein